MLDKLRNSLNKYDIISFDIFDTLLLRPYAKPSNVFQHLEEINNSIGFYAVRKIAENNLRKYKDIEYANYDEIYSVLQSDFQFLKEKEIQLEKDTLYANPQMKEIFDYAKSLNKRIILISDMYFSSDEYYYPETGDSTENDINKEMNDLYKKYNNETWQYYAMDSFYNVLTEYYYSKNIIS